MMIMSNNVPKPIPIRMTWSFPGVVQTILCDISRDIRLGTEEAQVVPVMRGGGISECA